MAAHKPCRLLSYGSVVLDSDDLQLLQDGQWLNDRLITFASEYLMDQLLPEERERIELVCASTCETLKFAAEFTSWLADYATRAVILFVVNNNRDPTRPGGTHWSLLIYEKERCRFAYLDSLFSPDTSAAEIIMRNAARYLCPGVRPRLHIVPCPKQQNSHDCGMLVVEFIRYMLTHGRRSPSKALDMLAVARMDAGFIRECRENWRILIGDLVRRNGNEQRT